MSITFKKEVNTENLVDSTKFKCDVSQCTVQYTQFSPKHIFSVPDK